MSLRASGENINTDWSLRGPAAIARSAMTLPRLAAARSVPHLVATGAPVAMFRHGATGGGGTDSIATPEAG